MTTRQDNITVEGGPSLFDQEPQATPSKELAALYDELNELRQLVDDGGLYFALPNASLAAKSEIFYNNHIGEIQKVFEAAGTPADVVNVVLDDYVNGLFGSRIPRATPDQMKTALKAIKPYKAFSIDRYGLYWALLLNYSRCLNMYRNYEYDVIGVTATPESKKGFTSGFYSAAEARAVLWLASIGEMTPATFADVLDVSTVGAFIEWCGQQANLYDYTAFYFVAKYALLATPQELDAITKPRIHSNTPVIDYAERLAVEANERLGNTAEKYGVMFQAERKADEERAEAEAKEARQDWQSKANTTLRLHETPNIICSAPVQISPNGAEIITTLPIQRYIDRFSPVHPEYGLITQSTVYKVFEAVGLLPNYATPRIGDNGKLIYNISRSKLAEICGNPDANQKEKLALVGSLVLLNNLYVVVDRPLRVQEFKSMNGKTRRRTYGGRTAVQIVNVPEYETDNEGLTVVVTPEAFKGRPTYVTFEDYKRLKAEAKGLSKSRFFYQILTKGHKNENDLVNDVFGYDEKLKLAEGDPEAMKVAKTYIQNHRADDKKKIAAWFKQYAEAGDITYSYKAPKKGTRDGGVYSWERVKPVEAYEAPDEQ